MIELLDVPMHVRLHRSPPLIVRVAISFLGSAVALLLLAPIVSRLWERPKPIEAIVAIVVLRSPSDISRRAYATVVVGLGMLVGATLELLVAEGERQKAEQIVLFNEVTRVDGIALVLVIAAVFLGGVLAARTREREVALSKQVYLRWLLVSIAYPVVLLWSLLVIYDVLGIAGFL